VIILAVDPGINTGWARVRDGRLSSCGLVRAATPRALRQMVEERSPFDRLVVEKPQVYRSRKSRGDPNDLIDVAVFAGCVLGAADAAEERFAHELVVPRDWKGTIDKDVMIRRVLAWLREDERGVFERAGAPASLAHNVVDAVGLGIWYARRLGERE